MPGFLKDEDLYPLDVLEDAELQPFERQNTDVNDGHQCLQNLTLVKLGFMFGNLANNEVAQQVDIDLLPFTGSAPIRLCDRKSPPQKAYDGPRFLRIRGNKVPDPRPRLSLPRCFLDGLALEESFDQQSRARQPLHSSPRTRVGAKA